jgi:two-component system sensor kinase FixL
MHDPTVAAPTSALSRELRWLIALRWAAGLTVVAGIVTNAFWVDWTPMHGRIIVIGLVILAYNIGFRLLFARRDPAGLGAATLVAIALAQILLDLACLTLLTIWTGGLSSPLLGLFVLHMVFASLLLPTVAAYAVAPAAVCMVAIGLALTGQWPDAHAPMLLGGGWVLTLLLTVFLTNHITESLREREAALRRQHRQTRSILDTAADGIITVDERGVLRSANPAAEQMFGGPADRMIGQPITNLLQALDAESAESMMQRLIVESAGRRTSEWAELTGRRHDGSPFPLEIAFTEVRLGGERSFTGVIRDISEHKRAEAELRSLNDELRRQQQVLVQHEKMAAMGQMAAGVAHEISNPLANMDSMLQLLERQPERVSVESLSTLRSQIERIRRTIHQMRFFAHPHEDCWEHAAIDSVVWNALEMVRFDHRIRGVEVIRDFTADCASVRMMPHAIEQVLVNLVLNALDALDGSTSPRLDIRTRSDTDACIIEIADNGRGIEPAHLDRIFEPFFTTKPVGQGTGLGLSISFSLIQKHGGEMTVQSTVGQGTTFTIRLPNETD